MLYRLVFDFAIREWVTAHLHPHSALPDPTKFVCTRVRPALSSTGPILASLHRHIYITPP